MPQLSRQKPRVRYDEPVQLSPLEGDVTVEAIGKNLSEGGIYVDATRPLAVGSSVRCQLRVDGRDIVIAGEVAWAEDLAKPDGSNGHEAPGRRRRTDTKTLVRLGSELVDGSDVEPDRKSGLGIRFDAVDEDASSVLRDAVQKGEPLTTPVELRFLGLDEPVHAQANATADGIALQTRLPFLELGSPVSFRLRGDTTDRQGSVCDVVVDADPVRPSIPRLTVELALAGRPRAKPDGDAGDDDASVGASVEAGIDSDAEPAAAAPRLALGVEAPKAAPASRRTLALAALLGVILGLAVGLALGSGTRTGTGAATGTGAGAATGTGAVTGTGTKTVTGTGAKTATGTGAGAATGTGTVPGTGAQTGAPAPAPAPTTSIPVVSRAPDGATTLFVPMTGDGTGMQVYELTSPGLAVTLPNAKPRLAQGMYGIHEGIVRRIWIKEHAGNNQVRVIYRRKNVRHQVEFGHGGLRITLR